MNILYEGMIGTAADPAWGWGLLVGGVILFIVGLLLNTSGYIGDGLMGVIVAITTACIILGILNLIDSRVPIVKATLNDTVSYQEINEKYKLRTVEGELYTFEVKNVTPDEWELHLNK